MTSLDGISGSLIQTSLSGVSDQRRRLKFRLFYTVTELSRCNLGVTFFKGLMSRSYLINFLITSGLLWLARTVCYSQLNLTSDRLLSDSMWFLCRFRHIRYVESGSYRNLIDSFCQHFHGKHRNKNTEPKQNKKYGNVSSMTEHLYGTSTNKK